jgi:hypothetical protein
LVGRFVGLGVGRRVGFFVGLFVGLFLVGLGFLVGAFLFVGTAFSSCRCATLPCRGSFEVPLSLLLALSGAVLSPAAAVIVVAADLPNKTSNGCPRTAAVSIAPPACASDINKLIAADAHDVFGVATALSSLSTVHPDDTASYRGTACARDAATAVLSG